jgi:hypothetical protein
MMDGPFWEAEKYPKWEKSLRDHHSMNRGIAASCNPE